MNPICNFCNNAEKTCCAEADKNYEAEQAKREREKNAEIRDYANESARVINVEINRLCSRKILQKVRRGEHRLNKEFIK